jgi:LysM repeat protein
MKNTRLVCLLALIFSGCSIFSKNAVEPQSLLTPYITSTPASLPTATPTQEPLPTAVPTPSPTPFVHTLASNETISSLAFTYNLTVNEILAINPQITPKALSVGTEIMIPFIGTVEAEKSAIESVISAPLALNVSAAECTGTAEGGLWCVAQVENPLEQSANGITLTFTLQDGAGQSVSEQSVPALLNLLAPGENLPVVAYFSPAVPAVYRVQAILKTALPVGETGAGSTPVEIKVNSIDADGRAALVSAQIPVLTADSGASRVWVALIAYDETGKVVGVRRLEYAALTEGEEGQAIKAYVYSNSADIAKVIVLAEAQITKQ